MVRPNFWIDKRVERERAASTQLTQSDRAVVGVVSGTHESDPVSIPEGWVEVTIPGSQEPPVVVPADGGITSLGAEVLCKRDSSGRITSASTPTRLPAGAEPVAVGVTGEWLAGLDALTATLDGAQGELSDAQAALKAHLAELGIDTDSVTVTDELWARLAVFVQITTQQLIAGGAKITGELLADVIQLATRLVAGNVELDSTGLHNYRTTVDGNRLEVLRFGVDGSPDYLLVTGADGATIASISDGGGASFSSVDSGTSLTYQGTELSDLLADQSRGIVAWGGGWPWGGDVTHTLSTDESICDLTVDLDAARMYSIGVELGWTSGNDSAALDARIRMTSTTDGTAPASPTSGTDMWGSRRFSGLKSGQSRQDSVHGWQFQPSTSGTYRLLLSAAPAYVSNGATLSYTTAIPRIYVRDEGPALPQMTNASSVIVPSGSTASTPSAVKRWIRDYSCSWGQSYRADGTMYSGMDPSVIQGYGGGPGRMGMLGFQTMTADLSGASINAMYVYLYFQHWWNNAGGTAVIGVHGQASKPSTYSASDGVVSRSGWPNPGGLWVPLPSQVWNGFKSGQYRGVSVRAPGDSTAAEYYGYIDPSKCKIRIDFNK